MIGVTKYRNKFPLKSIKLRLLSLPYILITQV